MKIDSNFYEDFPCSRHSHFVCLKVRTIGKEFSSYKTEMIMFVLCQLQIDPAFGSTDGKKCREINVKKWHQQGI